jgi:superfamily II DNA or RNA helicase
VPGDARRSVLVDLLTVYGEGGKAIVFTQTKREADEVAASVGGHLPCGALHGDMSQREREKVLANFRANKVGEQWRLTVEVVCCVVLLRAASVLVVVVSRLGCRPAGQ